MLMIRNCPSSFRRSMKNSQSAVSLTGVSRSPASQHSRGDHYHRQFFGPDGKSHSPKARECSRHLRSCPKVIAIPGLLPNILEEVASASLDVVLCISVLEHMWDPLALLRHCVRIVRPEGICCGSTLAKPPSNRPRDAVRSNGLLDCCLATADAKQQNRLLHGNG